MKSNLKPISLSLSNENVVANVNVGRYIFLVDDKAARANSGQLKVQQKDGKRSEKDNPIFNAKCGNEGKVKVQQQLSIVILVYV